MEENLELKSRFRLLKDAKDLTIYNRYEQLIAIDGAQVLEVYKQIKSEFPEINSDSTIWAIRKRVKKKLKDKKAKN